MDIKLEKNSDNRSLTGADVEALKGELPSEVFEELLATELTVEARLAIGTTLFERGVDEGYEEVARRIRAATVGAT